MVNSLSVDKQKSAIRHCFFGINSLLHELLIKILANCLKLLIAFDRVGLKLVSVKQKNQWFMAFSSYYKYKILLLRS